MNPSYRIDHEGSAEGGSDVRGAVLLMLCGGTAFWLNIQSKPSDWPDLEPTSERILRRFAAAP